MTVDIRYAAIARLHDRIHFHADQIRRVAGRAEHLAWMKSMGQHIKALRAKVAKLETGDG